MPNRAAANGHDHDIGRMLAQQRAHEEAKRQVALALRGQLLNPEQIRQLNLSLAALRWDGENADQAVLMVATSSERIDVPLAPETAKSLLEQLRDKLEPASI